MTERLITALVILAITIPIVIVGKLPFLILGMILVVLATIELLNVLPNTKYVPFEVKAMTILFTLYVVFSGFKVDSLPVVGAASGVNLLSVSLMVGLLLIVPLYRKKFNIGDVGFFLMTIFYVGTTFHAMLYLRFLGLAYLLLVVVIAAVSDSAAYMVGKKFGRHKLAPLISPNKTVEGAIGGTFFGVVIGTVLAYQTGISTDIVFLGSVTAVISIMGTVGDLIASSIKRHYQVKDFGNLFPGHGGVLDRLDSHLFASLVFYLVLNLMNVVN